MLTRDQLLSDAARALPREIVRVPELGGDVIVQGMSGTARDAWEAGLIKGKGKKREVNTLNMRAKLVQACCVTEDGAPMFAPEDIPAIGAMRADILDRLFDSAKRLSGLTDEDEDELGQPSS
jgi:hypothetical protein